MRTRLAAVALLAALTSGCTAELATLIEVTSPSMTTAQVTTTFTGDAATTIGGDPELRDAVTALYVERLGVEPGRDNRDGRLVYTARVNYETLIGSADVTGVSQATLSAHDDGTATLTVTLVRPERLIAAIRDEAAQHPDGDALAAALLGSTTSSVTVRFPGDVVAEADGGVPVVVEGRDAAVAQPLTEYVAGTLRVTGSTRQPLLRRVPVLLAGGAALAMVGLWAASRRST